MKAIYTVLIYGDANGDGNVNLDDVTHMLKYIAGWEGITIIEKAGDVTSDGNINLEDVTHLLKYIAGWEGITL